MENINKEIIEIIKENCNSKELQEKFLILKDVLSKKKELNERWQEIKEVSMSIENIFDEYIRIYETSKINCILGIIQEYNSTRDYRIHRIKKLIDWFEIKDFEKNIKLFIE